MIRSGEDGHMDLLRGLAAQLRHRNAQQSWAFKDVFNAHQGLLGLNEKLRQQTLDQDKVTRQAFYGAVQCSVTSTTYYMLIMPQAAG